MVVGLPGFSDGKSCHFLQFLVDFDEKTCNFLCVDLFLLGDCLNPSLP